MEYEVTVGNRDYILYDEDDLQRVWDIWDNEDYEDQNEFEDILEDFGIEFDYAI